jgi:hypothetical protein
MLTSATVSLLMIVHYAEAPDGRNLFPAPSTRLTIAPSPFAGDARSREENMSGQTIVPGLIGFAMGALTLVVVLLGASDDFYRSERAKSATIAPAPPANEEFEAVERRLRDLRNREWNLLDDMQPCFTGSRLCFLLSGSTP